MKKISNISICALLILALNSCKPEVVIKGSGDLNFTSEFYFGSAPFVFNSSGLIYKNAAGNSLNINTLKYYLSNFVLVNDKGEETQLNNYQLIDLETPASLNFSFPKIKNANYTKLKFFIGVDSIANSTGVHTGALDPANGMDWGWNFGYRFFLIEGRYKATDTSSVAGYSYHIGTNPCLTKMEIPMICTLNDDSRTITFRLDLEKVFATPNKWDISKDDYSHSSNSSEVLIAKKLTENIKGALNISNIK